MRALTEALAVAEGASSKKAKVSAIAKALRAVVERDPAHVAFAARLCAGMLVAAGDPRALGVGFALVLDAASAASGVDASFIATRARATGDLGTAVGEAMAEAEARAPRVDLPLAEVEQGVEALLATTLPRAKRAVLDRLLAKGSGLDARYVVRALLGEMRVGAKEGLVLDAIAEASGATKEAVRRAASIVTDVGEAARLAFAGRLDEASIRPGRPVGFMLASPLEAAKGVRLDLPHAAEPKVDGIRAQAHVTRDGVWLFARGTGPVDVAFPDVVGPLAEAAARGVPEAILDGELVVWSAREGRPRPFAALQQRLKKRAPDEALLAASPVRYLVYDVLWEDGTSLLDRPFTERRARLEAWCGSPHVPPLVVPLASPRLASAEAVEKAFEEARAAGYEGVVLKRLDAPYAAGVRGFAWLKVKKALATLDVVIVAAERGHGRRAAVLSDYTFAVKDAAGELRVVGKAYSGLTDVEIKTLTSRLEGLALGPEEHGRLSVKPEVVLEVGFDGIQRSDRHGSGFALRFPRIVNLREDKAAADIDTVATVQALFDAQVAAGHREDAPPAAPPKKPRGRKSGYRPDVRVKTKQLKLFDD